MPPGLSETVNSRTDTTIAKRKNIIDNGSVETLTT